MTDRELMEMALDALMTCQEDWIFDGEDERPTMTYDEKLVSAAFKALRARLAQPEQEPVAWMHTTATGDIYFRKKPHDKVFSPQPVYTAPPQREWQGLTDEEIKEQSDLLEGEWISYEGFARAIEAKLKEKNGGV